MTFAAPIDWGGFQYYALSHSQKLGEDGGVVTAAAGYLRTKPKGPLPLRGEASTGSLQVGYPLLRRYDRSLYLSGSLDGVNSENALLGRTLANERTRAARVAASYSRTSPTNAIGLSMALSQGLDSLGARTVSRGISRPTYTKLNAQASLDRQLHPTWVARIRTMAQYSNDPLPAAELMSLGSDAFGRGFEASFLSGDRGVGGSAELAWRTSDLPRLLTGSELYSFVDGGNVRINKRLGPGGTVRLASGGVGARVAIAAKTVVQIEAAKAIEDTSPAHRHGWRITASYRALY